MIFIIVIAIITKYLTRLPGRRSSSIMKTYVSTSMKWLAVASLTASILTACGGGDKTATQGGKDQPPAQSQTPAQSQPPAASPQPSAPAASANALADAYKVITDEMGKAKDSKPDYALVAKTYNETFKAIAQKRDSENSETTDAFIKAAIEGATDGKMDSMVAKQIVDKLLQKVLYTSMKASLKSVSDNWAKPEEAKKALAEAKQYYSPVLESTVKKRDDAFKTTMVDTIKGAFGEIDKQIGQPSQLQFNLARQVVDKTLMKTFYLAAGAKDAGYAYKVEKGAQEGKNVKVEQAEGWAFFQSINKYIAGQDKEGADFVNKQFELGTDPKTVKGDAINSALVRGLAKVALDEYKASEESWGSDKAAITGMEGALFIDMISLDITRLQGEAAYTTLKGQAEQYNKLVKDNKKDEAVALLGSIRTALNDVIAKAK